MFRELLVIKKQMIRYVGHRKGMEVEAAGLNLYEFEDALAGNGPLPALGWSLVLNVCPEAEVEGNSCDVDELVNIIVWEPEDDEILEKENAISVKAGSGLGAYLFRLRKGKPSQLVVFTPDDPDTGYLVHSFFIAESFERQATRILGAGGFGCLLLAQDGAAEPHALKFESLTKVTSISRWEMESKRAFEITEIGNMPFTLQTLGYVHVRPTDITGLIDIVDIGGGGEVDSPFLEAKGRDLLLKGCPRFAEALPQALQVGVLTTELINGGTLDQYHIHDLDDLRNLAFEGIVTLFTLHTDRELLHNDIKPQNILVDDSARSEDQAFVFNMPGAMTASLLELYRTADTKVPLEEKDIQFLLRPGRRTIRLIDFGLASFVGYDPEDPNECHSGGGTPAFLPLESYATKLPLCRVPAYDLWGFALTMLRVLSRQLQFNWDKLYGRVTASKTKPASTGVPDEVLYHSLLRSQLLEKAHMKNILPELNGLQVAFGVGRGKALYEWLGKSYADFGRAHWASLIDEIDRFLGPDSTAPLWTLLAEMSVWTTDSKYHAKGAGQITRHALFFKPLVTQIPAAVKHAKRIDLPSDQKEKLLLNPTYLHNARLLREAKKKLDVTLASPQKQQKPKGKSKARAGTTSAAKTVLVAEETLPYPQKHGKSSSSRTK